MADAGTSRLSAMGYKRARLLLVVVGMAVLGILAAILFVRRVDTVEVVATLLFVPIFLAFVFLHAKGGLVAAVAAAVTYAAMRQPAIDAVGFGHFAGLIASRSTAYLIFGLVGGWAMQTLELSLDKLDIYDQIDDETGLFNARFFVQDSDLEIARSRRYQTLFSIAEVTFPGAPVEAIGHRKAKAVLRDLGRQVGESVRTVDRAVHAREGERHHLAVVLPETAGDGARVFGERFTDKLHQFLLDRGCSIERSAMQLALVTVPGDDDALQDMRRRYAAIDGLEHEHPVTA